MKPHDSPTQGRTTGSRKVEPRKRRTSPSDRRRAAIRAIRRAVETAHGINATAVQRQAARMASEANLAAMSTTQLERLYETFRQDKRVIYATGLVPEGQPYRARTWSPR